MATLALLLIVTAAIAWLVSALVSLLWGGWVIEALIATTLIAQKSLADHVRQVADALDLSLEDGREAVSRIVGRDPAKLDEEAVCRAAIESLAENCSDGIVAPALSYALLGLPGLALYKAINTADSMIGHKSERFLHFGWAAARLDDLVNLPFSRLTGLLFAAASPGRFTEAWRLMRRDAPQHVSPNAGWPEAAIAAALGIRLGGPRSYGGRHVELAWMGEGRKELDRTDIRDGLNLYGRAMTLLFLGVLALAIVT
jgi:adenosylcobinamide-phosphate synthase